MTSSLVHAVLAMAITGAPALEVEGEGTCPAASDVAARLNGLLPEVAASGGGAPARRARLRREASGLVVELRDHAGIQLALRRIAATASCSDLAAAAAVVIATWEVELRFGGSLHAATPLSGPAALATPSVAQRADVREQGPPPRRLELAVGALAFLAEANAVPGASLEAQAAGAGRGPGVRAALQGAASRVASLGRGTGAWTRLILAVGPAYRWLRGPVVIDLHGAALGGLLLVRGSGYESNHRAFDVAPGLGAGLRLGLRLGRFVPWAGVSGAWWPLRRELVVDGLTGGSTLPQLEILAGGGLAFEVRR